MPETWTGTPAEWDAERDRRVEEMRARVPFVSRHVTDAVAICSDCRSAITVQEQERAA